MKWQTLIKFIVIALLFSSCAGYRFVSNDNPLKSDGISTIAIPMFINYSNLPEINTLYTQQVYHLMNSFAGLKVVSGERNDVDGVLIGIIDSPKLFKDSYTVSSTKKTPVEIKDRKTFDYVNETRLKFSVRIVLIKHPTVRELELLKNPELSAIIGQSSKVIFDQTFKQERTFSRIVEIENIPASQVNYTRNKGLFEKTVMDMAEDFARTFKETVVNVY